MSDEWDLPEQGLVFWPVSNGDAVTVALDSETVMQVDLKPVRAETDDEEQTPLVERLRGCLPVDGDLAILDVLVLTHHDADHCTGFAALVDDDSIQVDELWVTLRSFVEDEADDELSTEGEAILNEVRRRRDCEKDASPGRAAAGDRLQIIGYSDLFESADWTGFNEELRHIPGDLVATFNTKDLGGDVELFIHSPMKADVESDDGDRNRSSLGFHLTMTDADDSTLKALLLGDLAYAQIEAFFAATVQHDNEDRLEWDVLLAPHHGSRNAVRRKDGDEWIDAGSAEMLESYANEGAVVIMSSRPLTNNDVQPPHEDALEIYEGMVGASNVLCTADQEGSEPDPVTVVPSAVGPELRSARSSFQDAARSVALIGGLKAGDSSTAESSDQGFA